MVKRTPARDERGQILILTALSMTMLLGIAALSIDVSFMYDKRNRLYAAADAAAKIAATEVHRGNAANKLAFAQTQVVAHGLSLGSVSLTVRQCNEAGNTCTGAFAGNAEYVEALVSEVTPTYFGKVLGFTSLNPGARAVAGTNHGPGCLVVFNDLNIGNAEITQPNCGALIGGALNGGGGHSGITANQIGAGSWNGNGAMSPTPITPSVRPDDPLASLPTPVIPGVCGVGVGATLLPGCYTTITAHAMVLSPGLYIITGSLIMGNNDTLSGAGVTLYFGPSATVNLGNHDTLTLSAPTATSDPYNGIAWFFDRANANPINVANNTDINFTGAFYAKSSAVDLGNHIGNSGDCSLMVVGALTLNNGNGQLSNTCSSFGGSPILTVSVAE